MDIEGSNSRTRIIKTDQSSRHADLVLNSSDESKKDSYIIHFIGTINQACESVHFIGAYQ